MQNSNDQSENIRRTGIDRHIQFIVEHPRITLTFLFVLSLLMITLPLQELRDKVVEVTALRDGITYSDLIREVRTVYTSEVVNRLEGIDVHVSHNYSEVDHAIPIPAKFIEEVGRKMNEVHPGSQTRVYGPFPLNQEKGLADGFAREAWQALSAGESESFYRFDTLEGIPVLRIAVADRMRQGCVDCHNHHPMAQKRDWKVNEIGGIVEVIRPVKESIRISEVLESRTVLAGLLMSFIIFFILNMMIAYLKKTSSNLREKGEELRASELRHRAILQTTPAAVITINSHGIIQHFNPAAEKIFGYREKEVLFRKVNVLMPNDVAKIHDGLIKTYLDTKVAKVIGIGREVTARHRDGHEFPIRLSLGEINIHDETYFTAVIEDVSDAKRIANELLETRNFAENIIESMTDMLMVVDTEGSLQRVNHRFLVALGYSDEEIFTKKLSDILSFGSRDGVGVRFESLYEEAIKGNLIESEAQFKTRSGEIIPVRISGSALIDTGQDKIKGVIFSAQDERDSRLVKELQETHLQLVQKGKMAALGELSSGIGHELNNPLHFIKGFNDLIRVAFEKGRPVTFEEIQDYLESIDRNCNRMKTIIEHFRNLAGQSEMKFRLISINKVLEDSFILLNERMKLSSITILKEFANEDLHVFGDPHRLEQVFISILTNARESIEKAHGVHGGEIAICTFVDEGSAVVEIRDNGLGIAPENLDRIYNPFYTTKETGAGTGLGLSIAHGVLKDHNGRISCSSTLGGGAMFRIVLPLQMSRGEALRAG